MYIMLVMSSVATAIVLCLNVVSGCLRRLLGPGKAKMNGQKCVVITGCDSGFGEMAAVHLSGLGYHVVAACMTVAGRDRMQVLVARAVLCDITKDDDVAKLVSATEDLCKAKDYRVWALVNNAGIAIGGPLDWISMDVYQKVMDVNFFGHVRVTKSMLPLLKQQRHSRVINISSVAGLYCSANLSAYGASKHAIEGFMKSVREELKPWYIYVSNINPGFMRTPMATNSAAAGLKTYENTPPDIRAQYVDPRPNYAEGERLINKTLEDPLLVVKSIEQAITDAWPTMWYYPGYASNIARVMGIASSDFIDYFMSALLIGTVNQPTPEAISKSQ